LSFFFKNIFPKRACYLKKSAGGAETHIVVAVRVGPAGVVAVWHTQVVRRVVPAAATYTGSNL